MIGADLDLDYAPDPVVGARTDADWLTVPDSMVSVLRNYQIEHLEAASTVIRRGVHRILMQGATGSGKTHEIVAIAKAARAAGLRVLILATRTRVVRQLHDRLTAFGVRHGVLAAALPRLRDYAATTQVCSIDTLYRRAVVDERMPLPGADVVIFDEAHLALGDSRVTILQRYPAAWLFGFTATPAKVSGRPLCELFEELIPGPAVRELIEAKRLVRPRVFSTPSLSMAQLDNVSRDSKTGDYVVSELGELMAKPKLVGDVLTNWLRIANGKRTLVFACNKAHGAALLGEFLRAGVAAELLTDQTPEAEREDAIGRLERGETLVLVNCFLLSYGIDIPSLACVVLARPTRSLALYLQAVGRGLRPALGKDCCIVIDHGRVVESLGMPHEDFGWSLDAGSNANREARQRESQRRSASTESTRSCPECSHIWLVSENGPGCTSCGWQPAPKAKKVQALEVDLEEIAAIKRDADADRFFAQALGWYSRRWADRWADRPKSARWWAWVQTKEVLKIERDKPPGRYWEVSPALPSPEVAGKLQSRMIAFARARAKQETQA